MHTLPSGLRIIASVEPEAAVSYVGLGVRVGARDEGLRWHGLAHSIEHMLFKGTRLRSSSQIIERMESVGAELNAYTTKEETMLYAIAPSRYARRSLHMILDIAAHSTFPEREWAKEQEVILDEIHSYEDSPSELIFDEFEDQVFRPHCLGHAISVPRLRWGASRWRRSAASIALTTVLSVWCSLPVVYSIWMI